MKNRLGLFYVVTTFFWFSLYAYVPYVTPFADEMGADLRLVGLIAGAYGFTQMALRFPLGIFSDRIGKRKIFVLLGMAFAAASGFIVFFFPSPHTLLISRALGGVAASAWVTFTILGTSYFPQNETTKAMGHMSALSGLGRMSALLAGGLIAQWLGLQHAFLLGGIGGLIGLVLGLGTKENVPHVNEKVHPNITELLGVVKNRQLLCCSILSILIMFISFATAFGFTPLAAQQLGASQFQLGLLGVFATLPAIFISPIASTTMPQKLGISTTLVIGFIFAGIGSIAIAFSHNLTSLFIVQIVGAIGAAIGNALLLGLCIRDIPPQRRATAMGFFQAVYGLGMFLGPFAMGWVSHGFGLMTAFVVIGLVGALGAIGSVLSVRQGWINH
ncbi:MAG: MFS transporter [Defluviitaleaceae bacterium]|nr:MFS transporter [Defluviitaleaceae bacterium]